MIMLSNYIIIFCAILCIDFTKTAGGDSIQTDDLEDEYYYVETVVTENFIPQDEKDAQDIWDSNRNEEVIASILMYREKIRRYAITQKILDKIESLKNKRRRWIVETHHPQKKLNSTSTFKDLCFGLTYNENQVLGAYLENFFDNKDEPWINIGMVLVKNMLNMISMYNHAHGIDSFKTLRKSQESPFENMLRVWVRHTREPIEKSKLNCEDIKKDANALKAEQDNGGWCENRDQIELVLMKKSILYAREVIKEFEKANKDKAIEDIITDNIKHGLNENLADTYASLACYIKNKHKYISHILGKYCDGKDEWAAWIMCIAVIHPQEWPKVDEIFKKDHNGDSLSKFIVQKLTTDKVMAEMIALTVDSKFKPTTFLHRNLEQNDPGKPPGTIPSLPPPVVPTVSATPPTKPPP